MKARISVVVALSLAAFLSVHPFHARADSHAARSPAASAEADEDRPPGRLMTSESLAEGKRTFYVHCTFCHGQEAGGGVGQKLTDIDTVYGGGFTDMVNVITRGVRLKGMRGYLVRLGDERIAQVAAYLYTIQGTQSPSNQSLRTGALFLLAPGVAVWFR
jgi:cytochrome c oxidase cbb3-type subunit 3